MTDQELDEAYLDLPESERDEIYRDACDSLVDYDGFAFLSDWAKERKINSQIRTMIRERLINKEWY